MGRPKRIQFPGACYYVSLVGNNRQDLFLSNQDRRSFLAFLRAGKERRRLKVYAFCLLGQEIHLVLETEEANLSAAMQGLGTTYSKYFNGAHHSSGHVFSGRYKAVLIDKERQLAEATRYVHLQPVRAGIKDKPWRYPWSSCAAYVEAGPSEPLVDNEAVLARFGKGWLKQSVRYLSFIKLRLKSAGELPPPQALEADAASAMNAGGAEAAAAAAPDRAGETRRVLAEVAAESGVAVERLVGRLQWRDVSAARRVAIHRLWKDLGLGVTEIARLVGRTPGAVSQVIRSVETPRFRRAI